MRTCAFPQCKKLGAIKQSSARNYGHKIPRLFQGSLEGESVSEQPIILLEDGYFWRESCNQSSVIPNHLALSFRKRVGRFKTITLNLFPLRHTAVLLPPWKPSFSNNQRADIKISVERKKAYFYRTNDFGNSFKYLVITVALISPWAIKSSVGRVHYGCSNPSITHCSCLQSAW